MEWLIVVCQVPQSLVPLEDLEQAQAALIPGIVLTLDLVLVQIPARVLIRELGKVLGRELGKALGKVQAQVQGSIVLNL